MFARIRGRVKREEGILMQEIAAPAQKSIEGEPHRWWSEGVFQADSCAPDGTARVRAARIRLQEKLLYGEWA